MRNYTGDLCRSILAQAHECLPPDQRGAFYVVFDHGEFRMYPFGRSANPRWFYRVDPCWESRWPFPVWTFQVLGVWY